LKEIPLILSKLASTKQSTSSIQKYWNFWEWRDGNKEDKHDFVAGIKAIS